jgi:ectoine hydroxylase-related dioxygenase (phytanoyl-CoA dioxygenase family)
MVQTYANLPDLSEEYPVSDRQVEEFQRNGHILLRGVASPAEVAAYRPIVGEAVARLKKETRPLEERDTYGKAFLQIVNLWLKDEGVRRFVFSRRFAGVAARLLQVDSVRLYHDQALYKEAGGGHTPWHQDQYYWPLDTGSAMGSITMWMPLVDASVEMGTMTFASGSHHDGYLGKLEISDESEAYFRRYIQERGFSLVSAGAMAAGDATFHAGWTLHSAPPNTTSRMREVMTIIYYAGGIRILTPDNPHRQADLEAFFPGQKPGEVAATALNPQLYP